MKKVVKILAICLVLSLFITTFSGCGISQYTVQGTWISGMEGFTLERDGSYTKVTMSYSGDITDAEFGEYTITGNKVILRDSSTGEKTIYRYRNGKLVNNGQEFKKT